MILLANKMIEKVAVIVAEIKEKWVKVQKVYRSKTLFI
jgi:hypothetical protein